jgi:hypothetical protein
MQYVTDNNGHKGAFFDKTLVTMVKNCIGKIQYHEAENVRKFFIVGFDD